MKNLNELLSVPKKEKSGVGVWEGNVKTMKTVDTNQ